MTSYIIPAIVLAMCLIGFWLMLRDTEKHPVRGDETITEDTKKRNMKGMLIYSAVMTVLTAAISVWFGSRYADHHVFNNIKCMMLLSILWPVAYIDFRTYRIPNTFILFGLIARAALIPFELLIDSDYAKFSLVSGLIAAGAMLLAAVVCAVLAKGSIGFGDMKLFIVLGLFLEMEGSWGAMFLSLILSLVVSVALILLKKIKRTDSVPFGPAIMLGTYLSVCLTGM